MDEKELTILIMVYNRFEYTKLTLDAVGMYTDFSCVKEILVGDAGSTDGTRELLDTYEFIDRIYEVPFGSIAINIRNGARLASSKYVMILGNDMLVCQDWNRYALDAIHTGNQYGIRIVGWGIPDGHLEEAIAGDPRKYSPKLKTRYLHREPIEGDGFTLYPSWQAGGRWITDLELLLSENQFGRLGQFGEGIVYYGWWYWHLGFQNQIAAMVPRIPVLPIEFMEDLPYVFSTMKYRLEEPLEPIVAEALKCNPAKLRQEYIDKGWMRDFNFYIGQKEHDKEKVRMIG